MRTTQWTKAKETLKKMILEAIKEFEKDIKDYETLKKAALNGFNTFKEASLGGRFVVGNYKLAQLFCTQKQLERLENRKRFPKGVGGWPWVDIQARALSQCVLEIAKDLGYKLPSSVVFNEIEKKSY